jgi:hypothetical protein
MNDGHAWFRFSLLAVLWVIVIQLQCIASAIQLHQ